MTEDRAELEDKLKGVGTAPGQYLGYSLQSVRLTTHLLKAHETASVSLEKYDDVAVHLSDGRHILEQTKSATSQNPVSDWAVDLWKTFANWIETTKSLELNPNQTEYILYVSPEKTGKRVEALHKAHSFDQVEEIVTAIKNDLRKRSASTACAEYIQVFLDADTTLRSALVQNFSIQGNEDPLDELRQHLSGLVSPGIIDDICDAAIGWVKNRTDTKIRNKETAIIPVSEFNNHLLNIIKKQDRDHILNSFASDPEKSSLDAEIVRRMYIRQLELIDCDSDEKLSAATDFLKAASNRTAWSERGLVDEQSLADFDKRLEHQWKNTKKSVSILAQDKSDVELGGLLFSETLKVNNHRLQGKDVPYDFPSGSYHALAENLVVGWHPNFATLLKINKESGNDD